MNKQLPTSVEWLNNSCPWDVWFESVTYLQSPKDHQNLSNLHIFLLEMIENCKKNPDCRFCIQCREKFIAESALIW